METQSEAVLPAATPRQSGARRFRMVRTVTALMLREMTTTYGRSAGGYAWTLLEPVGGIMILTLIFASGLKLRTPSLGISFALFYATGLLAFMAYVRIQGKISQSIIASRALLRYPAVTFVDALVARFLLNTMTVAMIFTIVSGAILVTMDTRAVLDIPSILLSLLMGWTLGLGIGTLNAYLVPMYPVYGSVWSILTTPLFFVSGILYIYEELPRMGQDILWYNPLIHVTAMMRKGFYAQYDATFVSPLYVFSIALVTLILGLVVIRRNYRRLVDGSY